MFGSRAAVADADAVTIDECVTDVAPGLRRSGTDRRFLHLAA
jgi:hypothetical protein